MKLKLFLLLALFFPPFFGSAYTHKPKLPLYIYKGTSLHELNLYSPTCWVGDVTSFSFDNFSRIKPKSNKYCMRFKYFPKAASVFGWSGIYWTFPGYNWGNVNGGIDLTGAKKLTFWARSNLRTAYIAVNFGGSYGTYSDTAAVKLGVIELSRKWQQFSIDLSGQDLSFISRGFSMIIRKEDYSGEPIMRRVNPTITIYLDEIVIQ